MKNLETTKHRVDHFDRQTHRIFVPSNPMQIYIAGDLDTARRICREYCMTYGLCANIQANEYIYTGGSEYGVRVELINYPRFPSSEEDLLYRAKELMYDLMYMLQQESATIQTKRETYWFSRRESDVAYLTKDI